MTDFPIDIAEKILLLTDNPCKYVRVSKTWYRASKKNNFYHKYVTKRYQQDLGPLLDYQSIWVKSGGNNLDLTKIHSNCAKWKPVYNCTFNNLPDIDKIVECTSDAKKNRGKTYFISLFGINKQPGIKYDMPQDLNIDLGTQKIILWGPDNPGVTVDNCGCFGRLSIPRTDKNNVFFEWFVNLETKVEKDILESVKYKDINLVMKKKIPAVRTTCAGPDSGNWFNLSMRNKRSAIYSTHISANKLDTNCPVICDNLYFNHNSRYFYKNIKTPQIPVGYKWVGQAKVILWLSRVWIMGSMNMYGVSVEPTLIFLPDSLPPILIEPFKGFFKTLNFQCPCAECKMNKKWNKYLDTYAAQDYYRTCQFGILGIDEPGLPFEEKSIIKKLYPQSVNYVVESVTKNEGPLIFAKKIVEPIHDDFLM